MVCYEGTLQRPGRAMSVRGRSRALVGFVDYENVSEQAGNVV